MRHQARLSSAVPHSTAFLPPAFIAMLPPTTDASAEVGSTAKTKPAAMRGFLDAPGDDTCLGEQRRHRLPTPGNAVGWTGSMRSSFSMLMTAANGVSGTALPV